MKTLTEVEKITGIKSDNLRQRIHRGTIKATKKGRDWLLSEVAVSKLLDEKHLKEWTYYYSNCCNALMDYNQNICPECMEPCEKELEL